MFDMVLNSIRLFFQGKLFQDQKKVMVDVAIGAAVTTVVLVGGAFAGLPLWASAGLAGLVGGALQPWLFRDLKYA